MPASPAAPRWITGAHDGIAVRVTAHPGVIALCAAFGGAIVSTSANRAGMPAAASAFAALDPAVVAGVDGVLEGETGGLERPARSATPAPARCCGSESSANPAASAAFAFAARAQDARMGRMSPGSCVFLAFAIAALHALRRARKT